MPPLARVQFVHEFAMIEDGKISSWRETPVENRVGEPFAPEFIYRALQQYRRNAAVMGRQEDAEEYLGFLLDGLHEEFLSVIKKQKAEGLDAQGSPKSKKTATDFGELKAANTDDDSDWLEVGPKNKTAVTRDVRIEGKESPISKIFGGRLRSVVKAQGLKASVTLQPFHSLQLDISVCLPFIFLAHLFRCG